MSKKLAFAVFGLVIVVALASAPKASAQVRIGVQIGTPAHAVLVQPAYRSGYHEGYYYEDSYRYQRDARGYRHYDRAFGGHSAREWKRDHAHRNGNHHDNHHPDGDHRDWHR